MKQYCGNCMYHKYDKEDKEWICENDESECCGCITEYTDTCMDWEYKD